MHKIYIVLILYVIIINRNAACQSRFGTYLPDNSVNVLHSVKGIFYAGIDNAFLLDNSLTMNCDSILITSNNGTVFYDSIFFVSIPEKSGNVRLMIYQLIGNDTIYMGYRNVKVTNVPQPKIMFDKTVIQNYSSVSKRFLLSTDSISVFYSEDIIDSQFWTVVESFVLGYNYGGYYLSHHNEGRFFTNETRQIINTIGPEKQITFKIVVSSPGRVIREFPLYRLYLY